MVEDFLKLRPDKSGKSVPYPNIKTDQELANKLGFLGELAFAAFSNQFPDTNRYEGGNDKGIDFVIPLRFTVDVKFSRRNQLLVREGRVSADIYVLAHHPDPIGDDTIPELVGWTWGHLVSAKPLQESPWGGHMNHVLEATELKPMGDLKARLATWNY